MIIDIIKKKRKDVNYIDNTLIIRKMQKKLTKSEIVE